MSLFDNHVGFMNGLYSWQQKQALQSNLLHTLIKYLITYYLVAAYFYTYTRENKWELFGMTTYFG